MNTVLRILTASVAAVALVVGMTSCAGAPMSRDARVPHVRPVAGDPGLNDELIQVGEGPGVVDLYVDALCPYCKLFKMNQADSPVRRAAC